MIEEIGFELKKIEGSHHVYGKRNQPPISIQRDKKNKDKAKKYQVTQIIKRVKKLLEQED